jgi:hypothetical protein
MGEDPPKSPLKRGTKSLVSPLTKGGIESTTGVKDKFKNTLLTTKLLIIN